MTTTPPNTFSRLVLQLKDTDPRLRKSAIQQLRHSYGAQSQPYFQEALQDKKAPVRAEAVRALRACGNQHTLPVLFPLLDDRSTAVRKAVIRALFALRDPQLIPRLQPFLDDPDPMIQKVAAETLGRLKDPQVIPLLIPLLSDPRISMRYYAIGAVRPCKKDSQVVAALKLLLLDGHTWIRRAALKVLGKESIAQLTAMLASADNEERHIAVELVGMLNDPELLPLLRPLLNDPCADIRKDVARVLYQLKEPQLLTLLTPLLNDPDKWVCSIVIDLLGLMEDRSIIPLIKPLLKDQSLQWHVERALSNLEKV